MIKDKVTELHIAASNTDEEKELAELKEALEKDFEKATDKK